MSTHMMAHYSVVFCLTDHFWIPRVSKCLSHEQFQSTCKNWEIICLETRREWLCDGHSSLTAKAVSDSDTGLQH